MELEEDCGPYAVRPAPPPPKISAVKRRQSDLAVPVRSGPWRAVDSRPPAPGLRPRVGRWMHRRTGHASQAPEDRVDPRRPGRSTAPSWLEGLQCAQCKLNSVSTRPWLLRCGSICPGRGTLSTRDGRHDLPPLGCLWCTPAGGC